MSITRIACILGVLLATACPRYGYSQVLYGSVTGNVTDPAGAAVPGVQVEAVNQGTNLRMEGNTDERGVFRFTNLQTGLYKVTVTAKAFRTYVESNVQVSANDVRRVDVQLQIAQTTEAVEVTADAVVLQTDKADIHSSVTSQEVQQLPYNGGEGKNFQSLLLLLPGAATTAGTGEANSEAGNPQRAITVYMNGVSSQANNTRLDGTTISYPWLAGERGLYPAGGGHPGSQREHQRVRRRARFGGRRGGQRDHQVGHQSTARRAVRAEHE